MKEDKMKFDIFLSYSHPDEHIAHELEQKFTASGLRCFSMGTSLHGGDEWVRKVRESVKESENIVILITPRSVDSKWIFIEVGAAWMENKRIIPVLQFVNMSELPEVIKNVQCVRIETEAEKLSLIHNIANTRETESSVKISLDFLLDNVQHAKSKMNQDRFTPNLFIGSGRGGGICAGIFASHYSQTPYKVVDCQFRGTGKERITEIDGSSLQPEDIIGRNVLVVEWVRQSGRTFSMIKERLEKLNPGGLKSYSLFWKKGKGDIKQVRGEPPDYYGIKCEEVPDNPWGIF